MITLDQLKIDRRVAPIDVSGKPEFSWTFQETSTECQKACRLEVATNRELLSLDQPDVFDTGIRKTRKNLGLFYAGPSLASRALYYVKLIVIGDEGGTDVLLSSFETTLSEKEWKGKWIGVGDSWNGGALSIRKTLDPFAKRIVRARAYIAGIGYHEFYVNGKKIGDAVLSPGVTDYDKVVLYQTYDITEALKGQGDVIGVLLGYGWYGARKLLAQIYVDFEDGSDYEVHSYCNYGWWFAPSPILANSIYSGETYDARIEDEYPGGFSSPELKPDYNSHWFGSILTQPAHGVLKAETNPPIRVFQSYLGKQIAQFGNNDFVYDVSQNIAGWCQIKVRGDRGAIVTLRHAETLKADGHIDQTNLRTASAKDTYILKGGEEETYAPRFTYHGFRYVEVTIEGNATLHSLCAQHVHSDNKAISTFACSDEKLNRLHRMAVITEENNEHSILTDCPQRDERFGWLNDLSTRVYQAVYNFDLDLLIRKFDGDITRCQDEAGAITDTAPYYTGGRPADVTSLSYLLLAKAAYDNYGDVSAIKENYAGHKAWVDFLLSHSKNFEMDYYYYADWVSCDNYKDAHSDGFFVSNIFLYWHLTVLAELAGILKKTKDRKRYSKLAADCKAAFNRKYLHGGIYHEGTQCENAMALNLGLCPASNERQVYQSLIQDIKNHDMHITCGNQGYRHVMYQLCEKGDVDLLIGILENPTYPGWGFMLENNATTVWERWEKENQATMNSFDHPMFASYDAALMRYLGGIRIENGCSKIVISPKIPTALSFVESSLETPLGKIVSSWRKEQGKWHYHIVVPPNQSAKLIIDKEPISLNGSPLRTTTIELRSGTHDLVAR